jgi:hypothetical protein
MDMVRRMRAAALIGAYLTAGCYSYLPITSVTPAPGTSVGVTLTDVGTAELEPYLGTNVFIVRGSFVRADEQGVFLSVATVETRLGDWHAWAGETVRIPTADVASMRVRRFARGRTLLLAAVGVAGIAATTAAFTLSGGGPASTPIPPPPPK